MTVHAENAWAAEPFLPVPEAAASPGTVPGEFDPRMGGALVWVAEIEAALNGGTLALGGSAHADDAHGAEPLPFTAAGGAETILVSDLGWRGPAPYPPLLLGGPDIERRVALAPDQGSTYAWGSLRLADLSVVPGVTLAGRDTAMRRVRIRVGQRGYDAARGMFTDPPPAMMRDAFLGVALTWRARADGAEVPLRDPSAWLDAPIGIRRFLGTGGAEGPASLAGRPFPIVRGGSVSAPVRACPVTLVDAATRRYRWTDGPSALVTVYEDGAAVYTNAGNLPGLGSSPGAGAYFSDNAAGELRLGSDPAGTVTVDGAGSTALLAATVLRDLLMVTAALPAGLLDEGSVLGTAGSFPYQGGWAFDGTETARDAVRPLRAALGARLVASRSGGLRVVAVARTTGLNDAPGHLRRILRRGGDADPARRAVDAAGVRLDGGLSANPCAVLHTQAHGHGGGARAAVAALAERGLAGRREPLALCAALAPRAGGDGAVAGGRRSGAGQCAGRAVGRAAIAVAGDASGRHGAAARPR